MSIAGRLGYVRVAQHELNRGEVLARTKSLRRRGVAKIVDKAPILELGRPIALARRDVLTHGITYERTGEHFEQSLFEPFEADAEYLVAVDHAPTTHIRVDSQTIERPIAETLDGSEQVGLFAKLPAGFKIDTPLGTYNPDWAVTSGCRQGPAVHLVSESKSDFTALRDDEVAKVRCGEAHFKAIGVDYVKAVTVEDILERLMGLE